jgi:hypothetical protein
VAVVQQPIQDGGGHDGVAEHAAPLGNRAVARHQHGATLVSPAHELEEQVRCVRLERQVAQLIHHQQLGLGEVDQLLLQTTLGMRPGQLRHQAGRRHEQRRVAAHDGLAAECHRQVRLAHARRSRDILPKNSSSSWSRFTTRTTHARGLKSRSWDDLDSATKIS